ncbi:MAG: tetratricopeptide repeat protein, partial [Candidatus Moranbacteria bacterium]|nr:tetratricopeptide repeat protein [Candidatus Moranbacteria bacterium]
KPIIKSQMPTEVYPNYKTSFKIMFSSWKEDALLGKGPGNYQLAYRLNRPEGLGDFWSVDFTGGNSFFTTLGTTTGILGTFSYMFLVFSGLVVFLKVVANSVTEKKDGGFMTIGVGASWVFLTAIMFFYFANMTTLMLWWLTLALMISIVEFNRKDDQNNEFVATSQNPRSSFSLSFAFVLVIIGLIAAVYLQSQSYVAAAHFYKALEEDAKGVKVENVMERLLKAVNLDASRDVYYRNISLAAFALANQRVAEKGQDLSADDSAYVSAMIRDALKSADAAVMLNPEDSQNYVALASVYEGVIATMEGAEDRALDNYRKAIEYDPKNPALYQKIANIYVILSDIEFSKTQQQNQTAELPEKSKEYLAQAKENINQALKIKNDYADANLLLSSIYEREGAIDSAIENEMRNKELYVGDPVINFRLGLLYYKKEAYQEAEQEFLQALKLNNKYANARYFLGLTYDKQGEKDKALEQLRLVQKDNQENDEVKKMIENLEAGRDIMDGLSSQQDNQAIQEQPSQSESQPSNEINPQYQQQQIPQEAVPQLDEIDENNSPENMPEETNENPESNNNLEPENPPVEKTE